MPTLPRAKGSNAWDWLPVYIDGDDLVVRGCWGTYFGDPSDDEDNGIGAGGFHVRAHPEFLGVSLPQRRFIGQFAGCPIPRIPICGPDPDAKPGQLVRVYSPTTGKTVTAMLCDLGPSRRTQNGIDLTIATAKALGLNLKRGRWKVDYRILEGAKRL